MTGEAVDLFAEVDQQADAFVVDIEAGGRKRRVNGTLLRTEWHVTFYGWSEPDDPRRGTDAWRRILSSTPLDEVTSDAIDFMWYTRAPNERVPKDRFATVAATTVRLPAGAWRITTVSDDGIRVFVDDRLVIGNWTMHAPTTEDTTVIQHPISYCLWHLDDG